MNNGNLISALRNMVDDIEKLGAGPLTVDVIVLKQALSSLQIAQRTSALVDAQNLLLKSYENTMERMDKLLTTPPEGWVLVPVEPTEAMEKVAFAAAGYPTNWGGLREIWSAVLAARPEEK